MHLFRLLRVSINCENKYIYSVKQFERLWMVQIWLAVKCLRLKHNGFIDDINLVVVYLKHIHLIGTILEINLCSLLTNMHHMKFIRLLKLCNPNGWNFYMQFKFISLNEIEMLKIGIWTYTIDRTTYFSICFLFTSPWFSMILICFRFI